MGLVGWSSWAGRIGSSSQMWAWRKRKGKGHYFPNLIFNAKTISENLEIVLKSRKIFRKSQKLQKKFLEIV
jgi:hypothetical protein